MFKTASGARRWRAGAALLALTILLASLLLTGCTGDPKTDDTPSVTTAARPEQTTAAPDTALPTETAAGTEPAETAAPETEPAETLPADWTPSLSKTDISFFGAGESYTLTVPGVPGGMEILWSAEDEEIAAVDQTGRVTAVGPGSAQVYAEVADARLSCWVRCQFDNPPAEGAPVLNSTDISFFGAGESYRLHVENVPEDAEIRWTSEDYGVASVDETGRVRAYGPGTIRVYAQVGDAVLSCWVRCQFAAPEVPRCSVPDGTWRVTLRKSGVTVQNEEAGIYVAQADLLERVQVTEEELEELEPYSKLDLSRFGLGTFRVTSADFGADGTGCTVTAGDAVLLFSREDDELWTLVDAAGEARYYSAGTARFVFDDDARVCEQAGEAGAQTRRANVLELFGKHPGAEETLTPVSIMVCDGIVAEAVWQYEP